MCSQRQEKAVPQPGEWLKCTYPVCNKIGVPVETRRRIFQVRAVRDLVKNPLGPEDYIRNELARRSRYLLTVWDDMEGEFRQVYHGSIDTKKPEVCRLRVDCEGEPIYHIERSRYDRRLAGRVLRSLRKEDAYRDITIRPEH